MKRALVVMSLIALTSTAHADNRKAWKVTFASAVAVGVGGVILQVHGRHQISDSRNALCDGGAYHDVDPSCPTSLDAGNAALTPAQVNELNDQGDSGKMMARIGLGTSVVAVAVAGVALYKGFIKSESSVVVTPTVSKDSAGAALSHTF
jgi:hypothetical protein